MSTILLQSRYLQTLARVASVVSAALSIVACGSSASPGLGAPGDGGTASAAGGGGGAAAAAGSASAAGGAVNIAGANTTGAGGAGLGGANAGSSGLGNTAACNQPTVTAVTACNSQYPMTSISALRSAKAGGCFELSHVGLVARTDSPSEPRLYLQDEGGTDSSAILAKCSSSAVHACAPAVKAKIPALFDTLAAGARLSVRGFFQVGAVTGFEEFYIEDIIDECQTVPRPAPISLAVSDIGRDARSPAKWFRRATVAIPAADPLVMYDFSPQELLTGTAKCPDYVGFAMIPRSAGTTTPLACAGQANPAPRTAVDPHEILVGRQFFNQFLFAADCACAGTSNLRIVSPTGAVSGSVLGYLILEQDKGSTVSYQVFQPAADQSFPIK